MTFDVAAFSGGNKMGEALAAIAKAIGDEATVSVGFLEGSTAGWNGPRPKGPSKKGSRKKSDNAKGSQVPAATVAFQLEYGNKFMPPRPFFSGMIAKQSPTWGRLIGAALKANGYNSKKALQMIGLKIKEQLQDSIINFDGPDISAATKARKQFAGGESKPLIDSHNMLNAVDFRVNE